MIFYWAIFLSRKNLRMYPSLLLVHSCLQSVWVLNFFWIMEHKLVKNQWNRSELREGNILYRMVYYALYVLQYPNFSLVHPFILGLLKVLSLGDGNLPDWNYFNFVFFFFFPSKIASSILEKEQYRAGCIQIFWYRVCQRCGYLRLPVTLGGVSVTLGKWLITR